MATLDLRDKGVFEVYIPKVADVLTFSGFSQLDTGYTLTLKDGETTVLTNTVGNGISLGATTIAWSYDTTTLDFKTYDLEIISDSRVMGVYFRRKGKIIVSDYVE